MRTYVLLVARLNCFRHCEERSDAAIHRKGTKAGLLRSARNDEEEPCMSIRKMIALHPDVQGASTSRSAMPRIT